MTEYQIFAELENNKAFVKAKQSTIEFDASVEGSEVLPNPAELLLSALSACILKNVERYSKKLHLPYRKAKVKIKGYRTDVPPVITKIEYVLEIDTDVEDRKLDLWHRNIIKFGTITNTLLRTCEIKGTIKRMKIND